MDAIFVQLHILEAEAQKDFQFNNIPALYGLSKAPVGPTKYGYLKHQSSIIDHRHQQHDKMKHGNLFLFVFPMLFCLICYRLQFCASLMVKFCEIKLKC
jgi:hypothetical protein